MIDYLSTHPPLHDLLLPEAWGVWARSHGLDPTVLAGLTVALLLGLTKTQAAARLGLCRQTVHRYCRSIHLTPPDEWLGLVSAFFALNPINPALIRRGVNP